MDNKYLHDLVTRLRLVVGIPVLGLEVYKKKDLDEAYTCAVRKVRDIHALKQEANFILKRED